MRLFLCFRQEIFTSFYSVSQVDTKQQLLCTRKQKITTNYVYGFSVYRNDSQCIIDNMRRLGQLEQVSKSINEPIKLYNYGSKLQYQVQKLRHIIYAHCRRRFWRYSRLCWLRVFNPNRDSNTLSVLYDSRKPQ